MRCTQEKKALKSTALVFPPQDEMCFNGHRSVLHASVIVPGGALITVKAASTLAVFNPALGTN